MKSIPKVIVITGASSGIGQALAEYYADKDITLAITGRNKERLQAVTNICERKGATVISAIIDVTDRDKMEQWITNIDDTHPIDMIIANAGISAGTGGVLIGEKPDQVRKVLDINLYGVLNTIDPAQQRMLQRKSGQIVIMSSLAGYRGWSGAPAYCASKAAVRIYGESLRGLLKKSNIKVNIICPGFVKSRITDVNEFPMPFYMEANKAAKIIAHGLRRNKGHIKFPFPSTITVWLLMIMPDFIAQHFLSNSPSKPANTQELH